MIVDEFMLPGAWHLTFSIDPNKSPLPNNELKLEEQKVAAMGTMKYMPPGSRRKGPNLRAPKTALSQSSGTTQAHWTPFFARGKIKVYLCSLGDGGPGKLSDCDSFALFIRNCLPTCSQRCSRSTAGQICLGSWSTTRPPTS